ncbi:MAG: asparaginase domain-containing protein [Anaerolineae bacterium]|jgi:L-asparaginase
MRVKIFTTGGSIDKRYSTQESEFTIGEPAVGRILRQANVTLDYEIEPLVRKDSLDVTESDRLLITERVLGDPTRRIVITHGTDTMIETARAFSSCQGKTIVLTGAMQPAACMDSDAAFNVGAGLIAAQILPAGVYLVMNGQLFDPRSAHKNAAADRFEAQGGAPRPVLDLTADADLPG